MAVCRKGGAKTSVFRLGHVCGHVSGTVRQYLVRAQLLFETMLGGHVAGMFGGMYQGMYRGIFRGGQAYLPTLVTPPLRNDPYDENYPPEHILDQQKAGSCQYTPADYFNPADSSLESHPLADLSKSRR